MKKYNIGNDYFEKKNSTRYKKNSNSKNNSKTSNSLKNNKSSDKPLKYHDDNISNKRNKKDSHFKSSNIRNSPNKNTTIYQEQLNKKSFDDWIWGKHSVYEALISERAINRIWCTTEIFSSEKFFILLKELKSKGVLVEEVSWKRLSQLTFGASHQGIAIQLAYSKTISLDKLINISKTNSTNPIILALDGITDPHNFGAIIRSAEAFDCKGIIIPQRRSAGLTGTVAKVAAGALEHIPISRVVNLNRALEELKKNGFLIVGLSGEGRVPILKFNEKTPLVVIVGAEDKGISLLTQKKMRFSFKDSS